MNLSKKTVYLTLLFLFVFSLAIFVFLCLYTSYHIRNSPANYMFTGLWITGAQIFITNVFGIVLSSYLFLLRKNILSPIQLLTKRSMEIEKTCDITSSIPVKTNDEISQLAWTFNALLDRMAETNYSLEKNIEDNSSMLERSIKDSISALMSMNQVLNLMEEVLSIPWRIIITDSNAVITKVNPAFTDITGFSESEVLGKNPGILKSDHHNEHFYRSMGESCCRRALVRRDMEQAQGRERVP